jgi:DNA-binding winged helix-turn-helix (wHTH) protein
MSEKQVLSANCEFDAARRVIRGRQGETELSPLACRLLQALLRQPGSTVSREELINELWAGNYLVGEPALNRLVSETRRAARGICDTPLIETVQKNGYRLVTAAGPVPATPVHSPLPWIWIVAALGAGIVVLVLIYLTIDASMGVIWSLKAGD